MKAFFVGKAVNIEHYISDFWEEVLRVSSMKEMDWTRHEKSDVIFCIYGEFEKPEEVEDVITVHLFNTDQAQEISLKSTLSPFDFYLPFECDHQDIEQLQVMLMGVLNQDDLEKDVQEVKEELEKRPIDEELLEEPNNNGAAIEVKDESEIDNDEDENIDLEVEDLDLGDDQEDFDMSIEDDDLDMELTDESIDLDEDTDVDLDDELTSDIVDIDFGSDDEIEIDEESSGIFMSGEDEDDEELATDADIDLEFGDDDEDDVSNIELSGEDELVDLGGGDATGDFDLSAADIDVDDEDEESLDFSTDDSTEDELDSLEVEDEDGLNIDLSGDDDEAIDLSSDDDDETDRTLIANDLDALKAEAKARRDAGEAVVGNDEDIVTEDGFVLEADDDEEEYEDTTGEFETDLSSESDTDDLDFSIDGEGEESHNEMTFSIGDNDENNHAEEGAMEFSLDDDEDDEPFLTETQEEEDSGDDFDLDGGFELDSGDVSATEEVETITQFQQEGVGTAESDAGTSDFNPDDMGIDFGENTSSEIIASPNMSHSEEPPMVRDNEVLNFGGISDENDLMNMQSTIREIREERQEFLVRIQEFERLNKELKQENLTLRAELDEKRIELSVLQKRQVSEREDVRDKLRLSEEKKLLFEEKLRRLQREYEKLEQKVHLDVEKIRKRERELENQLELVKMDAQSQIKSRDTKIMDLKRKIDSLEFNVKTSSNREQKNLEDKLRLESRLEKVMDQLKGSIRTLEEEVSVEDLKKIESH